MKHFSQKVLMLAFVMILAACGSSETEISENQKQYYSEKCNCSIVIGKDWNELDLYEKSAIQVAGDSIQASVFEVPRSGGGQLQSLEVHAGLIMGNLENTMVEYKLNSRRRLTIDGKKALQFSVYRVDADDQKTNDILTFIEGPTQFYQILTWVFPEDFTAKRTQMMEIAKSFQVKK